MALPVLRGVDARSIPVFPLNASRFGVETFGVRCAVDVRVDGNGRAEARVTIENATSENVACMPVIVDSAGTIARALEGEQRVCAARSGLAFVLTVDAAEAANVGLCLDDRTRRWLCRIDDGAQVPAHLTELRGEFRRVPSPLSHRLTFTLRNATDEPAFCRIYAHDGRNPVESGQRYLWIEPGTMETVGFTVPRAVRAIRGVRAEVRGAGCEHNIEHAIAPPSAWLRRCAYAAGILSVCSAVAAFAVRPHVLALAAPSSATASQILHVSYATSGLGHSTYLAHIGGATVRGALPAASGSFELPAPARAGVVDVVVTMQGYRARDEREIHIAVVPATRAAVPAQIASLDLDESVVPSGGVIHATLGGNVTGGNATLIDERGVPWQSTAFDDPRNVALLAPHVDRPTAFRLRVVGKYRNTIAQAVAGILVVPPTTARPPAHRKPLPRPAAALVVPNVSNASIAAAPSVPLSGTAFVARLAPARAGTRIVLQDERGVGLASAQTNARGEARFTAPAVAVPTTYALVTTAENGKSGEVIVQPLRIVPR